MPHWGMCRWCGGRTEPGHLDCATCEDEDQDQFPTGPELRAAVARWSIQVEGLDVIGGRKVEDVDTSWRL